MIRIASFATINGRNASSVLLCNVQKHSLKHEGASISTTAKLDRNSDQTPRDEQSSVLSSMRRGAGGRSSFSGVVATVFGATGFLGRYVVNQLGKMGSQVIIPYRREPHDIKYLKVMGDLGQILFFPFHLQDEESIRKCVKYSNVVINLVGRDFETSNFSFNDVHVKGSETLAKICREMDVEKLIHLSALNARPEPEGIFLPDGSNFYKSKYLGEQAVQSEFPNATIIRPSDMYGFEDRFINYYIKFWRRNYKWLPMWKKGEITIKQPVYVGDVSRAILNCIGDPSTDGKIYEAVGPRRYFLCDLVDWMYTVMRKTPALWGYKRTHFDPVTRMKITLNTLFQKNLPEMTWERTEREYTTDRRVKGLPDLEDLGIQPVRPIEDYAPWHLRYFLAHASYSESVGQFPAPPPPKEAGYQFGWT